MRSGADVRRQLLSKGLWLAENHPVAVARASTTRGSKTRGGGGGPAASVQAELKRLAARVNMRQAEIMSFGIERAPAPRSMTRSMKAMRPASTAFHVMVGRTTADQGATGAGSKTRGTRGGAKAKVEANGQAPVPSIVALIAKEVDGKIVSVRELHGK